MNYLPILRYLADCARCREPAALSNETRDELLAAGLMRETDKGWALTPAAKAAMREMGRPS